MILTGRGGDHLQKTVPDSEQRVAGLMDAAIGADVEPTDGPGMRLSWSRGCEVTWPSRDFKLAIDRGGLATEGLVRRPLALLQLAALKLELS
eukprot:764144-Pyramimonas_sp.AAC.1